MFSVGEIGIEIEIVSVLVVDQRHQTENVGVRRLGAEIGLLNLRKGSAVVAGTEIQSETVAGIETETGIAKVIREMTKEMVQVVNQGRSLQIEKKIGKDQNQRKRLSSLNLQNIIQGQLIRKKNKVA